IAMALGGQQADLRALVLQERVGGDRGPMYDSLRLHEKPIDRKPEILTKARQPGQHADRGIARRGGDFREDRAARGVNRDQVGEGTTDVDADAVHGQARFRLAVTRPGLASAATAVLGALTKPSSTSRAPPSRARFFGSPQPPPPPDSTMKTSPGRIGMPTSLVLMTRGGRP